MKNHFKIILITSIFFCYQLMPGQGIEWERTFGESGCDSAFEIQQTLDGGFVVAGVFGHNDSNGDFWVIKIAQNGVQEWEKKFGGSDFEQANSIHQTSDQGYIVAGYTKSNDGDVGNNNGTRSYWVVKLSEEGDLEWENSFGGSDLDEVYSVRQTSDEGFIVAGRTTFDVDSGWIDIWIIKLSADGNLEWEKTFGGSNLEYPTSIQQTLDQGYIIAGYTSSNDGDISHNNGLRDAWVLKLSQEGDLEWEKTFGGPGGDIASSIQQTLDGGFIIAGIYEQSITDTESWIIKISENGNLEWEKKFGGSNKEQANSIHQTTDQGFIVAGSTRSIDGDIGVNYGKFDYWVIKLSEAGDLEWERTYGGSETEVAASIQQTSDGGFIVAGVTLSNDGDIDDFNGEKDFWVLKLSSSPVGVNELDDNLSPTIFPNPSNGKFTISLDNFSDVKLIEIINVLGTTVYYSDNIKQTNEIEKLSTGVYWVKISSDTNNNLSKIIVH